MKRILRFLNKARIALIASVTAFICFTLATILLFTSVQTSLTLALSGVMALAVATLSIGLRVHQNTMIALNSRSLVGQFQASSERESQQVREYLRSLDHRSESLVGHLNENFTNTERQIGLATNQLIHKMDGLRFQRNHRETVWDKLSGNVGQDYYTTDKMLRQFSSGEKPDVTSDESKLDSVSANTEAMSRTDASFNEQWEEVAKLSYNSMKELEKRIEHLESDLRNFISSCVKNAQFSQLELIQDLITKISSEEIVTVPSELESESKS